MKKKAIILTYPTKFLLDILIVVAIIGCADIVVRILYKKELASYDAPLPEKHQGNLLLKGNPYLIFEYAPGVKVENGIELRINSLGLRGKEIEIPKPVNRRRLMTIGDSAVFGFGVDEEFVFSTIAAENLGEKFEAINGAIPGYSTYQSINLLRLRTLKTKPDLLVIGSLWSDNNFGSFVDKNLIATMAGFEESPIAKLHRFLSNSAIYRLADWRNRVKERAEKIKTVGQDLSLGDQTGYRRVSINDYASNLEIMVESAHANQAEVLFLLLPNEEDIKSKAQSYAWSSYRKVMRDTASRYGAPLLDGVSLFHESKLSSRELFIDKMHPSVQGHRIIGKKLAQMLQGWAKGEKLYTKGDGKEKPVYTDRFQKEIPNEKKTKKKKKTERIVGIEKKQEKQSNQQGKQNSKQSSSFETAQKQNQSSGPKPIPLAPTLEAELSEIDQKSDESIGVGKNPEQPYEVKIGLALISTHFSTIDRRLGQEIRDHNRDIQYRLALLHIVGRRSQPSTEKLLIEFLAAPELQATSAYLLSRIGTPGYPGRIRNRKELLAKLHQYLDANEDFTDPWLKKTLPVSDFILAACIRITDGELPKNLGPGLPNLSPESRSKYREQCLQSTNSR